MAQTSIIDPRDFQEAQEDYKNFLDDANSAHADSDLGNYEGAIKSMLENNEVRLPVRINDLRQQFPNRCKKLLKNGFHELAAFQAALLDVIKTKHHGVENSDKINECFVGLEGSFGVRHVTPRSLTARFLNNMVCVEGIVTRCSNIKPKIAKSVHYCDKTKKYKEVSYREVLLKFTSFMESTRVLNPASKKEFLSAMEVNVSLDMRTFRRKVVNKCYRPWKIFLSHNIFFEP